MSIPASSYPAYKGSTNVDLIEELRAAEEGGPAGEGEAEEAAAEGDGEVEEAAEALEDALEDGKEAAENGAEVSCPLLSAEVPVVRRGYAEHW